MNEELESMLKYLHLSDLLENWDEYLKLARKRNFSHVRLLKHIITQQYSAKKEKSRKLRIKRARIPEEYVLETYPFSRQPKINRKMILGLYDSMDYMLKKQNIIWMGPTGIGKTGLATSFLIHAMNNEYSGRYILFPELIETLYKSVADHSEHKVMKKLSSYDCLLIDEIGYVEVEPVQVGLFFTLMQKRHRKRTTLITTNPGFSEWLTFLRNEHLTAALIDRLTEDSHIINMKKCVSLRTKLKQI